jgi:hypothetical protein
MATAKEHLGAISEMSGVSVRKGGFKNVLTPEDLAEIQKTIDGTIPISGPTNHRNDGSHNPNSIAREFKKRGWSKRKIKAAKNVVKMHNVLDVAHSKPGQVVNGHIVTQDMIDRAREIEKNIRKGIRVKYPKWAKKVGKHMASNRVYKSMKIDSPEKDYYKKPPSRVVKRLKETKAGKKLLAYLEKCKHGTENAIKIAKPIQYLIILKETGEVAYKYLKEGDIDLEVLAESLAGAGGGWAGAEFGAKAGAVACTPLLTSGMGYVV